MELLIIFPYLTLPEVPLGVASRDFVKEKSQDNTHKKQKS